MVKIVLIFLGTLSLAIGIIGIVVPGLPTTSFLLISAACYVRSSDRMYNWLLNHKVLGKFIKDYRQHKAMPFKSKIIALVSMWFMMSISTIFFIQSNTIRVIVLLCGVIGTVVILRVKTLDEKMINSDNELKE